ESEVIFHSPLLSVGLMVRSLFSGTSRSRLWAVSVILGMIAAAGGGIAFWRQPSPHVQRIATAIEDDDDDFEDDAVANPGYVGMQACAACHAERVAEFETTNHARTFRVPEARAMPAGFEPGRGTFVTRDPSLRFEMTRTE